MKETASGRDARFDFWRMREAPGISFPQRLFLVALVSAGLLAVVRLGDWWFRAEHVADTAFFIFLSVAFWYDSRPIRVF